MDTTMCDDDSSSAKSQPLVPMEVGLPMSSSAGETETSLAEAIPSTSSTEEDDNGDANYIVICGSLHRLAIAGLKRASSQTDGLPATKRRSDSASPIKVDNSAPSLPNRIHRRIILRDYGKPIYEATSRTVLLSALEGCVQGHESLHQAGFLHRDISINNLIVNEDPDNPSWPSFLIDLDLGIKEARVQASGSRGKTGTKVFMAIGALQGEQHSFMHDLESFFWVLFWICIHYDGPGRGTKASRFDKWNYVDPEELAEIKKGLVSHEGDFIKRTEENFTPYYQSLIPWVNRLRKDLIAGGRRWENEDTTLYSQMTEVFRAARQDRKVLDDS